MVTSGDGSKDFDIFRNCNFDIIEFLSFLCHLKLHQYAFCLVYILGLYRQPSMLYFHIKVIHFKKKLIHV